MIYVNGYTFVVKNHSHQIPLELGKTYTLYHIRPFVENDKKLLKYTFVESQRSNERPLPIIDVVFPHSGEAENHIARVSGKIEELRAERKKIEDANTDTAL